MMTVEGIRDIADEYEITAVFLLLHPPGNPRGPRGGAGVVWKRQTKIYTA